MKKVSADPSKPYWIVLRMSKHGTPRDSGRFGAQFFRHSSESEAIDEAMRLAKKYTGKRFSVFASGVSVKNDALGGENSVEVQVGEKHEGGFPAE